MYIHSSIDTESQAAQLVTVRCSPCGVHDLYGYIEYVTIYSLLRTQHVITVQLSDRLRMS